MLRGVLLAMLLLAGTAHATQQDDLDKLRKRISALQQEFDKSSESKSEAADSLRESERAISNSNRKLHELAQQQLSANRELVQLQQRAAAIEGELQGQQAMLGRLLYQQYLDGGEQEYLKLLLNNDDPNQVAREFRYYEYIARNRAATLKSLRSGLAKLQAVTDQARKKSDEIAALQAEERDQKQHLEQDKRAHQQMLSKISVQMKQQRREIGRLQRNENRLSQLVEKLAQCIAERAAGQHSVQVAQGQAGVAGQRQGEQQIRRASSRKPDAVDRMVPANFSQPAGQSSGGRSGGICRLAARFRQSAYHRSRPRLHEFVRQ